ncbi:RlpA-like double-psi beta-barrel-protein domain-containing protein-containing protein [Aspergillus varians]
MRYTTSFNVATSVLSQSIGALAGLATTTHYSDGLQGACGCGNNAGAFNWQYGISSGVYTAAANQALFDGGMKHWCGSGCGKCYRLTSTGVSTCETCGAGGETGKSITVMVTNLCPFAGNEQWCANPGQLNAHGYGYHFDIMGAAGVFGDNVVVEFEETACPGDAGLKWKTCECHPDLKGKDILPGGDGIVGPGEAAVISGGAPAAPPAQTGRVEAVPETLVTVAKPIETAVLAPAPSAAPALVQA